jgi:hypothetical protein
VLELEDLEDRAFDLDVVAVLELVRGDSAHRSLVASPVVARGRPVKRRGPAPTGPIKAVGYIRVSEMGGRSGPELHTIEVQRASIERCARDHGWELVEVVEERNRSGADAKRPLWREIMERIEAGEIGAVAVWKISRFSRSLSDAVLDIRALEDAGAHIAAGEEPFDTTSPQGRLMMHMLLAMAEYEREILGEQFEVFLSASSSAARTSARFPSATTRCASPQRAAR